MAYEVKFGWVPDYELGYTAFQPDGAGRGIPNQHLPEVRVTGYYRDTPATALVVGDIVIVYRREIVEHDSVNVHYLDFEDVYYENIQTQYEGEYIKDFDTTSNQQVVLLSPVGSGEYDDLVGTTDSIDGLTTGQTTVLNQYDERDGGGGVGAGDGVESLVTHDC